jgi:hypothetical protein
MTDRIGMATLSAISPTEPTRHAFWQNKPDARVARRAHRFGRTKPIATHVPTDAALQKRTQTESWRNFNGCRFFPTRAAKDVLAEQPDWPDTRSQVPLFSQNEPKPNFPATSAM